MSKLIQMVNSQGIPFQVDSHGALMVHFEQAVHEHRGLHYKYQEETDTYLIVELNKVVKSKNEAKGEINKFIKSKSYELLYE